MDVVHGAVEKTEPVVLLSISSSITIKNCVFQRSKGQAVLLSEVSGDVNINFLHNNHYGGHGAAISYSGLFSRGKISRMHDALSF